GKFHAGNHTYEASTLWAVWDDATYKAINVTTGVKYTDLQAAVTAAHANDEIALLVDISGGSATITTPITFNMNGHSITGTGVTSNGVLYVQNMDGTVIVKNGTIPTIDGADADSKAYTGYLITENMNVTDGIWVDSHHLTMNGTYYKLIHNHGCGGNKDVFGDVYVKGYETYVENGVATDGSWTYGGGFIRLQGGFFGTNPLEANPKVPVYVDKGYRIEPLVPTVQREGKTYKYIVRPLLAFDAQNGTTPDSVTIKNPYETLDVMGITLPTPTKAGKETFQGWFTEPNGQGERVTADSKLDYIPQTIYAYWAEVMYTVSDSEDPTPVLSEIIGQTVKLEMLRTLVGGATNTFCAPFAMTETQIANSPLAGATIYAFQSAQVTQVTAATRRLEIYLDPITAFEAGQPMVIIPATDVVNPVFENVKIDCKDSLGQTATSEYVDYIGMISLDDVATRYQSSPDYLGVLPNGNLGWADATKSTGKMRGFRGLFHVKKVDDGTTGTSGAPKRGMPALFVRNQPSVVTDLETLLHSNNTVIKVRRGNQVVILRGNKMYNMNGQIVK
ncbi:MAG: InlB B-repeat-containing protein, partial [Paludibacteraceae bacterium]|nr:InlB B-repeat-containing protein [Paludibacteraceae bacterium]